MANLRSADVEPKRETSETFHFFIHLEILHSSPVVLLFFPFFPYDVFFSLAFKNLIRLAHPSRTLSSITTFSFLPLTLSATSRLSISFAFPHHPFSASFFPCLGFVKGGFISRPEWCRSAGSTDNGPIIRGKQSP